MFFIPFTTQIKVYTVNNYGQYRETLAWVINKHNQNTIVLSGLYSNFTLIFAPHNHSKINLKFIYFAIVLTSNQAIYKLQTKLQIGNVS